MFFFASLALAAPVMDVRVAPHDPLTAALGSAAQEYGVPEPILFALAQIGSRFNPDAWSKWGGYGMYDLREGDRDPSLEHAGALLEVDPNRIIGDWRLQIRGAAAILAEQGRASNGGILPRQDDLLAWWDAVRAFSGREEPFLQDQFAGTTFELIQRGSVVDTRWGTVFMPPHDLDLVGRVASPPPSGTDSPYADQYYAACSENYSDYSRDSGDIDMVVIHTVQGSYSGCYSWFANCSAEASAHYVVQSSTGAVTQMVDEEDVAWHAGNWDYNTRSVGIEHEGYVDDCSYYTDALYEGSAQLTADIASRQGVSLDRSHIIGHDEVPDPDGSGYGGSGHHTDPGDCWDWDYYMALLNGETGTSGGEIIGVVADTDIYNGTRLVGATVWIAETGETTTVESDGYYRFEDVPFGTYTMHASYSGYAEGTCTKTTSSSQDWCSIALYPETTGGDDTGEVDTQPPGDDTGVDTDPGDPEADLGPPAVPGTMTSMSEVGGGCGCATGTPAASWLLALLPLVGLRRR